MPNETAKECIRLTNDDDVIFSNWEANSTSLLVKEKSNINWLCHDPKISSVDFENTPWFRRSPEALWMELPVVFVSNDVCYQFILARWIIVLSLRFTRTLKVEFSETNSAWCKKDWKIYLQRKLLLQQKKFEYISLSLRRKSLKSSLITKKDGINTQR